VARSLLIRSIVTLHTCSPGVVTAEQFWSLWLRDRDYFLRTCLRWLRGNRSDAEDVMSRGALKALEFLRRCPGSVERFQPWAMRILQNLCIDRLRCAQRHAHGMGDADVNEDLAHTSAITPERMFFRGQLGSAVSEAVGTLPPRLKSAFCLRFVDDLGYDEISRRLVITPANARKRIEQARRLLRARLGGYSE
jgi:RNA polymerase sigma factor (sigma-70 family)